VYGQYTPLDEDEDPRLVGSFPEREDERRWRVVLKLEGTIDAYRLAKLVGDEERTEAYRKGALLAVEFLQEFSTVGATWTGFRCRDSRSAGRRTVLTIRRCGLRCPGTR